MSNIFNNILTYVGLNKKTKKVAHRLVVGLPYDRAQHGNISAFDQSGNLIGGPWAISGRSDRRIAAKYGNPEAARLRKYGDTPLGRYVVSERKAPIAKPGEDAVGFFGSQDILVCKPLEGEGLIAEASGRGPLLIHGGRKGPTLGSLRMPDEHMKQLLEFIPRNFSDLVQRITIDVLNQEDYIVELDQIDDGLDWYDFDAYYDLIDFNNDDDVWYPWEIEDTDWTPGQEYEYLMQGDERQCAEESDIEDNEACVVENNDVIAAQNLSDLGYNVLPDAVEPPPASKTVENTDTREAEVTSQQSHYEEDSSKDYTSTPTEPSYSPSGTSSSSGSYTPGGAYDR